MKLGTYECPYCHEVFTNEKKYNVHLAIEHEANPDGTPISVATIQSLEKVKDRVHFLLKKIPNTRNSDMLLYLYYLRYWGQYLVYNQNTKLIQFRNPEGISINEFIHLPAFETISRARRSIVAKHKELEPTDKIVAIRRAKEKAYHDYFANEKMNDDDYLPDTYIDFK